MKLILWLLLKFSLFASVCLTQQCLFLESFCPTDFVCDLEKISGPTACCITQSVIFNFLYRDTPFLWLSHTLIMSGIKIDLTFVRKLCIHSMTTQSFCTHRLFWSFLTTWSLVVHNVGTLPVACSCNSHYWLTGWSSGCLITPEPVFPAVKVWALWLSPCRQACGYECFSFFLASLSFISCIL